MNLQLHTRQQSGATVVEVGGEVELHNVPQLREELLRACKVDLPNVVVDLSKVIFIDSTGIGVLVGALKRVRERHGTFALVCPPGRVRRIFEITGLLRALPLFDSMEAAVSACRQDVAADESTG